MAEALNEKDWERVQVVNNATSTVFPAQPKYREYTGIQIAVNTANDSQDADKLLAERIEQMVNPLAYARRSAHEQREKGVRVYEVVIQVNGGYEELTFDELEARYRSQQ